jgi:hypothetical protein
MEQVIAYLEILGFKLLWLLYLKNSILVN